MHGEKNKARRFNKNHYFCVIIGEDFAANLLAPYQQYFLPVPRTKQGGIGHSQPINEIRIRGKEDQAFQNNSAPYYLYPWRFNNQRWNS